MNTYIAHYLKQKIVVEAPTLFEAQQKAAREFKVKRAYLVGVTLHKRQGEIVTHSPAEF